MAGRAAADQLRIALGLRLSPPARLRPAREAPGYGAHLAARAAQRRRPTRAVRQVQGVGVKRLLLLVLFLPVLAGCGVHTVDTGHRGIKTSFGQVEGPP